MLPAATAKIALFANYDLLSIESTINIRVKEYLKPTGALEILLSNKYEIKRLSHE